MADDEGDAPAGPAATAAVVAGLLVLTLVLTVWSAFLVPLRLGTVPAPVWLLPMAAVLALAAAAGRRLGLVGALPPALLWLGVSWLGFGAVRAEGDLVVPATASGYAYLYGGLVAWLVVVGRSAGRSRDDTATPGAPSRR